MQDEHAPNLAEVELLEVHLPVRPRRAGPAPAWLGTYAHGLVFHLLEHVDPALSAELHDGRGRAEFTASALLDLEGPPAIAVRPEGWYWLRLTFLTARMARVWAERLTRTIPRWIHLGPGDPFHRPDAGCPCDYELGPDPPLTWATRYEDLLTERADRWAVDFVTPATFQLPAAPDQRPARPVFLPLPGPEQVLSNLGAGWHQLAPPPLRELADRARVLALAQQVQLEQARIEVALLVLHNKGVEVERPAFAGTAVFAYQGDRRLSRREDEQRRRLLGALLRFGSFAGAGVQTARGMGLLRVEPR